MAGSQDKLVIGRVERVDFPGLGLVNLEARVDTGARTSSIHCTDVEVIEQGPGSRRTIAFTLLDPEHPDYDGRRLVATDAELLLVRSSNGEEQERHVITTAVRVAGRTIVTPFTLADREAMRYPVLIGRRLLRNNFLVDVAQRELADRLDEEE